MEVNHTFELDQRVVDKATKLEGRVVMLATDEYGNLYEIEFDQRLQGRRRHFKRTSEIKKPPKPRKRPDLHPK